MIQHFVEDNGLKKTVYSKETIRSHPLSSLFVDVCQEWETEVL